jgi:hypothetical protein
MQNQLRNLLAKRTTLRWNIKIISQGCSEFALNNIIHSQLYKSNHVKKENGRKEEKNN